MSEYDSILKEKKVYKDPEVHHSKYTKYIILDIVAVLVVLLISYMVYYHKVLSGENIFLNDISKIYKEYDIILDHLPLFYDEENYSLEGKMLLNDTLEYQYDVIRNDNRLRINLKDSLGEVIYYANQGTSYLKDVSFLEKYVNISRVSILNVSRNLKQNFNSVMSEDKYIKKFYIQDKRPVVEVNVILTTSDLIKLLGSHPLLSDDIQVIFTFQNNAFTNEIISMKVALNQLTKNTRDVYLYQNGSIEYTDNLGNKTKFVLSSKLEDFTLKIFKEDILYSVFAGVNMDNSYQYSYQIIDQVYSLYCLVLKDEQNYEIDFTSNIEMKEEVLKNKLHLEMLYSEDVFLEEDVSNSIMYSSLESEEREGFELSIGEKIEPLREFIEQYKESINQVND